MLAAAINALVWTSLASVVLAAYASYMVTESERTTARWHVSSAMERTDDLTLPADRAARCAEARATLEREQRAYPDMRFDGALSPRCQSDLLATESQLLAAAATPELDGREAACRAALDAKREALRTHPRDHYMDGGECERYR